MNLLVVETIVALLPFMPPTVPPTKGFGIFPTIRLHVGEFMGEYDL